MTEEQKDVQAYLARIRKTISDGESLVAQAELRIAETDRMLERQGLTREQVMNLRFSEAQIEAANAELKRRGLDPLERWSDGSSPEGQGPEEPAGDPVSPGLGASAASGDLENRRMKFGMMMKPFQI